MHRLFLLTTIFIASIASAQTKVPVVRGGAGGFSRIFPEDWRAGPCVGPPVGVTVDAFTIALWRLNEGSGSVLSADSGPALIDLDGEETGVVDPNNPRGYPARINNGIDVNTTTRQCVYVNDTTNPAGLNLLETTLRASTGNGYTVEAWVYPRTATDGSIITLSTFTTGLGQQTLQIKYTPGLMITVEWTVSPATFRTMNFPLAVLTINQWNHVAVTRTAGSGGFVAVWINGVMKQSLAALNVAQVIASPRYFAVGAEAGNTADLCADEPSNGLIDEVKISNTVRSEMEIYCDSHNVPRSPDGP